MKWIFLAFSLGLSVIAAEPDPSPDEYLEINADIDGDGIADRLVSEPIRDFGTAGGRWHVFIGKKEVGLTAIGEIFAHPLALRSEKLFDSVRLWVYLKDSGSAGSLGFYPLKDGRIGDLRSIEISPGDGGSDLGRAIYDAAFPAALRFTAIKKRPDHQSSEPAADNRRD